jgi:hypothetical protein
MHPPSQIKTRTFLLAPEVDVHNVSPSIIYKRLPFDSPLVEDQIVIPSTIKRLSFLDPPLDEVQEEFPLKI